eukprot:2690230-Pleurochrysis_carterae.AAC.4
MAPPLGERAGPSWPRAAKRSARRLETPSATSSSGARAFISVRARARRVRSFSPSSTKEPSFESLHSLWRHVLRAILVECICPVVLGIDTHSAPSQCTAGRNVSDATHVDVVVARYFHFVSKPYYLIGVGWGAAFAAVLVASVYTQCRQRASATHAPLSKDEDVDLSLCDASIPISNAAHESLYGSPTYGDQTYGHGARQ